MYSSTPKLSAVKYFAQSTALELSVPNIIIYYALDTDNRVDMKTSSILVLQVYLNQPFLKQQVDVTTSKAQSQSTQLLRE